MSGSHPAGWNSNAGRGPTIRAAAARAVEGHTWMKIPIVPPAGNRDDMGDGRCLGTQNRFGRALPSGLTISRRSAS